VDMIRTHVNNNRELIRQMSDLVPEEELKGLGSGSHEGGTGAGTGYGTGYEQEQELPDQDELDEVNAVESSVVKLQATARGFIGRNRAKRRIVHDEVIAQGVLAATMGTVQGDSGWYECKGMLFYFCVDEVCWRVSIYIVCLYIVYIVYIVCI